MFVKNCQQVANKNNVDKKWASDSIERPARLPLS